MDSSSHDKPLSEIKQCAVSNSENASFILRTGNLVTPQKRIGDRTPHLCTPGTVQSPLDFSTVTVEQLGITPESFVKTPSGKSSALQKARRRSTVGVRGSPETNCLIRFIAQQRNLKNATRSPLAHNSPFQGSPGLHRHASALRERMTAFRSAFHPVQESEKMAGDPTASKADRESKTSDLKDVVEYQQSGFPVNSSSKRRRISSQSSPDDLLSSAKGRAVPVQLLADQACAVGTSADLTEKSSDSGSAQLGWAVAPLPELTEVSHGRGVAGCVEGTGSVVAVPPGTPAAQKGSDTSPAIGSPVTPVCRSSSLPSETFALRSVLKKPGKQFSENVKEYNLCDDGPHLIPDPSNYRKEERAGREDCKSPGFLNLKKRKRVTFGADLSPEVFDESLPANTPLCKGGTPICQRNMNAASPRQSPVPTVQELFIQPHFDDQEENLENIEPAQMSFASLSETLPGTDPCGSLKNHEEVSYSVGRPTRTSHRRKQLVTSAQENVCSSNTTEAEPCKERNVNRRKSQERKCTSKALPGKKPVLKSYRKKKKKGKKSAEKCLYGERDIASKKPLLSPIPELPEVSEVMPLAHCMQKTCSDDFSISGELEEVIPLQIPGRRKRPLPREEDLPELEPAFDRSRCLLPITAPPGGVPNASARDTGRQGNSRAERKHHSAEEPKTKTQTESSPVSCAPVTHGHIVTDLPKALCSPWCQEFSKADQNTDSPCEILTVSETRNIKCEEDSECLAPKGSLQCDPFPSDYSERDRDSSEGVLVDHLKESTSHSENAGRKHAGNSNLTNDRERKRKRHSVHCCEGQSSYLEQNKNPASSCSGGSSAEISLGNPQLCEDLSAALELSFQRTSAKPRVRRSTRLQGDLGNTGLVWVLPPTPPKSQKSKRRTTICAFDSRGFETDSPERCSRKLLSLKRDPDSEPLQGTPTPFCFSPFRVLLGCDRIEGSPTPGKMTVVP
ncbi:hypothetical protein STEG23_011641 [Scotinomys teguina]